MREKIYAKRSNEIEAEMKRLFSNFSQMRNAGILRAINIWHPPTDVCETEMEFCIVCELAGVRKEDIRIHIEDNIITIAGARTQKGSVEKTVFHNLEINYGPFERNIQLPRKFIGSEPKATYNDGFLKVTIPARVLQETVEIDVKIA
jgi:HSP20 family protein